MNAVFPRRAGQGKRLWLRIRREPEGTTQGMCQVFTGRGTTPTPLYPQDYLLELSAVTMEISPLLRQQISESLKAPHTEKVADVAVKLWEQMAAQIILIFGKDGFHTLYARSLFLSQPKFPWLKSPKLLLQTDHRFEELKMCFEGQTPDEISAANSLLLITFAGILNALIGEELTASILRAAWGDTSNRPGKEFTNV